MAGPKHLWSGDWEDESAAARRPSRPDAPAGRPDGEPDGPPPGPPRRRRSLAAGAAFIAFGIAVIAVAAVVIAGHHHHATTSPENESTLPFTVTAPARTFSVPTPTTSTPAPGATVPSTPTPTAPTTPATPTTPQTRPAQTGTATQTTPKFTQQPVQWLGMEVVDGPAGAVIDTVSDTGAGGRAGLNPGDVIESIDGHPVSGPQQIAGVLRSAHSGELVPIVIQRNSATIELHIVLGAAPHTYP